MDKRKKMVLTASVIAGLLVVALIIGAIYKYVAPSNVKRELNTVFELGENEVALIVDNVIREEKGRKIDGQTYVPAAVASACMDERIYVDTKEKLLSYTTEGGLIQVTPGAVSYTLGREEKKAETVILSEQEDGLYISLSFIAERASCYFQEYEEPSRLVIMSDRAKTYTFAEMEDDTRVRTGPNKKYDYLTEVPEGERVIVDGTKPQENEYMAVTTLDGVSGYIPVDSVAKTEDAGWTFERTPVSFTQKALKEIVCLGWHQVTNEASSGVLSASVAQAPAMNVISPTWYALSDNKGNFTSLANAGYVAQAHAAGLEVWALVNDFADDINLNAVLGRTSSRTKLINALVASAIQYDLDGINIDFENVKAKNADAYLEFLRELVLRCHANDLVVSVDNYIPAEYNAFYNLEEQGRIVDYVILMAYDEHYSGSEESGSVSSLPFVKNGLEATVAKVPKKRVITALPFYTRLWKEIKNKSGEITLAPPTAYGMSGAESVIRANGASPKWDDATGQYYAQFKADGATYKIWLEEETSLEKKLEVVMAQDVAGVAFWKLGFERAVTWKTIDEALKKSK
ncbi:MAG: glycosyl hydrolase family 18 [Lachnospiraceae bacterium]|nr:glycosyl hydrolase family 18 [Lachnospiraceae bacterium]